jgi:hypothetical protein
MISHCRDFRRIGKIYSIFADAGQLWNPSPDPDPRELLDEFSGRSQVMAICRPNRFVLGKFCKSVA